MKPGEFKIEFDRIITEWPRSYSSEKVKRIYMIFCHSPIHELTRSINYVLDNHKFAPTPQEWSTVLRKSESKLNQFSPNKKLGCDFCDNGFIFVDDEKNLKGITYLGVPNTKKCANCYPKAR